MFTEAEEIRVVAAVHAFFARCALLYSITSRVLEIKFRVYKDGVFVP